MHFTPESPRPPYSARKSVVQPKLSPERKSLPSVLLTSEYRYSFRIGKESRLGQRHGLQNTTLTSYFFKNIYKKVIYINFYENIFQDKSIHIIFYICKLNNLKVIDDLYSQCLIQTLSKTTSLPIRREYLQHTEKG